MAMHSHSSEQNRHLQNRMQGSVERKVGNNGSPYQIGIKIPLLCILAVFAISPQTADAFLGFPAAKQLIAPLIKHSKTLKNEEIEALAARAAETGGLREVDKELGGMKLPEEVLEDTYMRIALYKSSNLPPGTGLSRTEAEGMMSRLSRTQGFRATIRKIAGNNPKQRAGHLNELRIADIAVQYRYTVKGIGISFNDGLKKMPTDIDVLLEKNGKTIAVEAKNYLPETPVPLDKFRADMDSLIAFKNLNASSDVLPVFSITKRPANPDIWFRLKQAAKQRNVQLIVGSPSEQLILIERLLIELRQ